MTFLQFWLPAIIGLIGPDLAMIGPVAGLQKGQLHPSVVARYNAVHRPWPALAVVALGLLSPWCLVLGLAWLVDRICGYGLRDAAGFQRAA
jgi:hypothetical protein